MLTSTQVANLETADFAALNTANIRALSTAAIAALTTDEVVALTTAQAAALGEHEVGQAALLRLREPGRVDVREHVGAVAVVVVVVPMVVQRQIGLHPVVGDLQFV